MSIVKELTCIGCPMGCALNVTIPETNEIPTGLSLEEAIQVTGNTCKRGDTYARKEVTHPTRIVTSSIPVDGGNLAMVSVKTDSDIPKECIFRIMEEIHQVRVNAPIQIGDILIPNVAGTGSNIIATRNVAVK